MKQQKSKNKLADIFVSLSDSKFVFVRPGGNWGDHLIYMGAELLADRIGLVYRTVNAVDIMEGELSKNETVYIHGGGGFTTHSSLKSLQLLEHLAKTHRGVLIQGPCTLDDDKKILQRLTNAISSNQNSTLYFFVRENVSYSIVTGASESVKHIYVDHDTAFHVNKRDFLCAAKIRSRKYTLCAVRTDTEKCSSQNELHFNGVNRDPATYCTSFEHWLRMHAAAEKIITNRTHSSVAGAILNIPTYLFANSYHKNYSIWEYSLKPKGVHWINIDDNSLNDCPNIIRKKTNRWLQLPPKISKSWKLKKIYDIICRVPLW